MVANVAPQCRKGGRGNRWQAVQKSRTGPVKGFFDIEYDSISEEQKAEDECHVRCFVSRFYCSIFPHCMYPYSIASADAVASHFQAFFTKKRILYHWEVAGFVNPTFRRNNYLTSGQPSHDKFNNALTKGLPPTARLALVFHGTPAQNIENILRRGLDPCRRSRQAYGLGEYFARHPIACQKYMEGSYKTLVFVVAIPDAVPSHSCLDAHHVIVPDNSMQLPIGVVDCEGIDSSRMVWIKPHRKAWCKNQRQNQLKTRSEFDEHKRKMVSIEIELLFVWKRKKAAETLRKDLERLFLERQSPLQMLPDDVPVEKTKETRNRTMLSARVSALLYAIDKSIDVCMRMEFANKRDFERDVTQLEIIRRQHERHRTNLLQVEDGRDDPLWHRNVKQSQIIGMSTADLHNASRW